MKSTPFFLFIFFVSIYLISCQKEDESKIIVMEVAEYTIKAPNILSPDSAPTERLFVLEQGNSNWETLYPDQIKGFNYEVGNRYVLKASKFRIADPPQDVSSIGYKLIEIISKTPVK